MSSRGALARDVPFSADPSGMKSARGGGQTPSAEGWDVLVFTTGAAPRQGRVERSEGIETETDVATGYLSRFAILRKVEQLNATGTAKNPESNACPQCPGPEWAGVRPSPQKGGSLPSWTTVSMPSRSSSRCGPMPESRRRRGVRIGPAHRITSLDAPTECRVQSRTDELEPRAARTVSVSLIA